MQLKNKLKSLEISIRPLEKEVFPYDLSKVSDDELDWLLEFYKKYEDESGSLAKDIPNEDQKVSERILNKCRRYTDES